ncbi:helix-turn-helix domain-containing protein [Marinobacter oulmenensis]|uniref:Transcriptional regulator with XRE-family HTH domain n=1 Tax=Marinobacter oulmenensis TaxID=643747 RepID=A0A840UCX0_9GAMM|nr:helix-turn-helix domain-containing protein [Marinobacter oulmenensis]MBB5321180.1 transcriptional regulator with XRE-family HTH domain [Marinobacter oulmenensis]
MTNDTENARAARLKEAVEKGPLNMNEIAEELGVARTSVLNWKRRGAINIDNLKGIAELTGYRFWWLAFGEGPKTYSEADGVSNQSPLTDVAKASPEHARLIECISHLTRIRVLTPELAEGITATLNAVAASKKD